MKNCIRRRFGLLLLIILLFVVIIIFAFFIVRDNDSISSSDDVSLKFVDDNMITISNILPISDEVGKKIQVSDNNKRVQNCFDFTIKSNVKKKVRYEVYLTKVSGAKEIESNYIKIYLTDSKTDNAYDGYNKNTVPTFFDLRVANSTPSGKQLYYGTLSNYGYKNFRLRMWLSDSYAITKESKSFSVKVNVKVF